MTPETPLVLAGEFPSPTAAEWREAVDRVLARGDAALDQAARDDRFRRQLVARTYDDVLIQPLYTRADTPPDGWATGSPGFWPFVRGSSVLGGVRYGWDVRQPIELAGPGPSAALEHLERGASSLLVRAGSPAAPLADGPGEVRVDLLDAALEGVYLDLVTVALDPDMGIAGASALCDLWKRRGIDSGAALGALGLDPLGVAASTGASEEELVAPGIALATACARQYPQVRSMVVDATRYHDAGASDAEEIGCATATGIAYLRLLTTSGLGLHEAFGQLEFRFAATADQFSTLAKFRAARRLWGHVAQVLGVPEVGAQRQHAMTSRAMLTRYDPWVNLLRNTVACFAAGSGGAEAVTVEPHDLFVGASAPAGTEPDDGSNETAPGGAPSELGRRMARNTQLLLIEESHLAGVLDPGGGSWYVEALTDALAQRSWEWLQQIEAVGGMAAALRSRVVQDRINETWERRAANLARRAETVVGVSDYPSPDAAPPPPARRPAAGGLARRRYAEPFETLRERADAHERLHGSRPMVLLVQLGSPADYTARATYAKAFFETSGMATVAHDLASADEPSSGPEPAGSLTTDLREAIDGCSAQLACLCSSDARYKAQGVRVVAALSTAGVATGITRTYVAARPGELGTALCGAGADELIYAGCDVLAALDRALTTVGVR